MSGLLQWFRRRQADGHLQDVSMEPVSETPPGLRDFCIDSIKRELAEGVYDDDPERKAAALRCLEQLKGGAA